MAILTFRIRSLGLAQVDATPGDLMTAYGMTISASQISAGWGHMYILGIGGSRSIDAHITALGPVAAASLGVTAQA